MATAEIFDVEARWRPLTAAETIVAQTRLDDVERMIRRKITDFDARIAADDDFKADVVQVEADAVIRVLKNPDAKRQESIDDYSWTRDRSISGGALRILLGEWELLGVRVGGRKAFMIDTTPPVALDEC